MDMQTAINAIMNEPNASLSSKGQGLRALNYLQFAKHDRLKGFVGSAQFYASKAENLRSLPLPQGIQEALDSYELNPDV